MTGVGNRVLSAGQAAPAVEAVLAVLEAEAAGRCLPLDEDEVLGRVYVAPLGPYDGRRRAWRLWNQARIDVSTALHGLHDRHLAQPVGWVYGRNSFWLPASSRWPCVACTEPGDPCTPDRAAVREGAG